MLAKTKLNSVKTLISQAFNDMEVSHEEFIIILKEEFKYERMKHTSESENEKQEIIKKGLLNYNQLNQQQKIIEHFTDLSYKTCIFIVKTGNTFTKILILISKKLKTNMI